MALSHALAVREDGGEALIGVVRAGLLSREIVLSGGADVFLNYGRLCRWRRYRESLVDPARSKNQARTKVSMRGNREVPWLPVVSSDASSWMVHGVVARC